MSALAVIAARPRSAPTPAVTDEQWPGVDDPQLLRAQLLDWFAQYANPDTRRTYAYALGVPVAWIAPRAAAPTRPAPPPPTPGPLHDLAWLRWCARQRLDPRAATSAHVKAWLHALDAAGGARRTRQRMLATVAALYAHLAETGVVAANPAAVNRARLGLGGHREVSPTVRLTVEQVRALLQATARPGPGRGDVRYGDAELLGTRAHAVVHLLTLGLRVSELTGADRADRYVTGGEQVLRVRGKGGHHREVYLTEPAATALDAYLAVRDHRAGAALPARRGQVDATAPLLATRSGGRLARSAVNALLRRAAAVAGPELDGVRDRIHPHALRHAYVTIALERGAPIPHVQVDVGHASIATTQHYDRGLRSRRSSAADLVAGALHTAGDDPD